jgi:multidrug resistance efflux pump
MKAILKLPASLTLLTVLGWLLLSINTAPNGRSDPVRDVSPSPSSEVIEGIGYIEPASELRRLTSRVNGIVIRCVAKEGQTLNPGDLIIELDRAVEERARDVAQARLALARSRLAELDSGVNRHRIQVAERMLDRMAEAYRHAVSEFERQESLSAQRAGTTADLERFRTLRDQSKLSLHEQEAELAHLRNYVTPEQRAIALAEENLATCELAQAEIAVQNTRITAPCAGQVLRYLKREGDGCSTFLNEPAVLFADTSSLRVRAEFDERFTSRLHRGLIAEIYGPTLGGKKFTGRVASIESLMGSRTVFARSASERKDLHVVELVIDLPSDFTAPLGLRVDVRLMVTPVTDK